MQNSIHGQKSKKTQIIEQTATFIKQNGFNQVSLRPLAKFIGTSDRMLLHYFETKEALMDVALEKIMEDMIQLLQDSNLPRSTPKEFFTLLPSILQTDKLRPFLRLWTEIASTRSPSNPFLNEIVAKLVCIFSQWIDSILIIPSNTNKDEVLSATLTIIEGFTMLELLGQSESVKKAAGFFATLWFDPVDS